MKKSNTEWFCPDVKASDCGVMRSKDQRYLNAGRLWEPTSWDVETRDRYLDALRKRLFADIKSKGPSFLDLEGVDTSTLTEEQFDIELERTPDVMKLNPLLDADDF
jgi:hypothetical protein